MKIYRYNYICIYYNYSSQQKNHTEYRRYRRSGNVRVKNISCVKISWRKIFVRPIVYENFLTGVKLRWRLSNESCVSAATTCTSAFGRLLWERFFTVNESRQTVETDTLWLSNIRALNFRKPGHLRKYCNNENFPIYGIIRV